MINHIRTLLLNADPANRPVIGTMGEQYIDPKFTPLQLPDSLKWVHTALFGEYGCVLYQNYRVAQYLAILTANKYTAPLLTHYDLRITHKNDCGLFFHDFITKVNAPAGIPRLQLTGPFNHITGDRLWYTWLITATSNDVLEVKDMGTGTATDIKIEPQPFEFELPARGGGQPVVLHEGTVMPGNTWTVEVQTRPDIFVTEIYQKIRDDVRVGKLFTQAPSTWYNLWKHGTNFIDKFGAILAAFAWQVETLRGGNR